MLHQPKHIDRRWMIGGTILAMASAACGRSAQSMTSGDIHRFDPRKFGAKGDGITDDAPAFQRAINAAAEAGGGIVTFGAGEYLLRYRPSEDGDGLSALTLRSGVIFEGMRRDRCILRLADKQMGPGTYARILASKGDIQDVALRRFTIDGNRQGQGAYRDDLSGAAVLLGWKGHCKRITVEELSVHDAIGQGIMLQGSIDNLSQNLQIANNTVERCSYIGIQSSQFNGLVIAGNTVNDCHDNGIDIYGDDTTGHSTTTTSGNAIIRNNKVNRCNVGIFLETVSDIVAESNIVIGCRSAGIRINRIHGEPRNLIIAQNQIADTQAGIAMGGETGGVIIRNNVIRGFTAAAIAFEYNVSNVTAVNNSFMPSTRNTPIIFGRPTVENATPPQRLLHIRIERNRIPARHTAAKIFDNHYSTLVDVNVGQFSATSAD
ncbi:right-handed parallel beta-helix repeat-containing protein [Sphingomonas sanguinis]|uniref:Right-handed parallel beta-helix repeat-containing protein n=1 Tax=Sphingomonas sanguinis TaxID=33051 RepID=A0ABU5LSY6_9SPHN|nr:right-handed parallel beta-helix repeat-containing protein [Sphingomonas sanguinis]MDZ7283021.1 right-handed parallel beta-helix repeat-containing protein [Sphingomonas sanguinis]